MKQFITTLCFVLEEKINSHKSHYTWENCFSFSCLTPVTYRLHSVQMGTQLCEQRADRKWVRCTYICLSVTEENHKNRRLVIICGSTVTPSNTRMQNKKYRSTVPNTLRSIAYYTLRKTRKEIDKIDCDKITAYLPCTCTVCAQLAVNSNSTVFLNKYIRCTVCSLCKSTQQFSTVNFISPTTGINLDILANKTASGTLR